jgi:hypothetical protein
VIAAHLARRHAEYGCALVILAGVLFDLGLIAGWVALCSAGIVVTAEEVFVWRRSTESEQFHPPDSAKFGVSSRSHGAPSGASRRRPVESTPTPAVSLGGPLPRLPKDF